MVARKEIPIRRPSGRRFVQRGQRLLLSSWPHKNVYCYPQRTIRPRRPRIDAAHDEIFRDWIVSLSRPSRSSPHSYSTSLPSLLLQPIFFYSFYSFYSNYPTFFLFFFSLSLFFISWLIIARGISRSLCGNAILKFDFLSYILRSIEIEYFSQMKISITNHFFE